MKIIAFGQIAEITGKTFPLDAPDTDTLRHDLETSFPEFAGKKYAIAVNKKIISQNTKLHPTDEIALMPPYSGG